MATNTIKSSFVNTIITKFHEFTSSVSNYCDILMFSLVELNDHIAQLRRLFPCLAKMLWANWWDSCWIFMIVNTNDASKWRNRSKRLHVDHEPVNNGSFINSHEGPEPSKPTCTNKEAYCMWACSYLCIGMMSNKVCWPLTRRQTFQSCRHVDFRHGYKIDDLTPFLAISPEVQCTKQF
jgi:hypothetical protein